jgi:hypothetical protein
MRVQKADGDDRRQRVDWGPMSHELPPLDSPSWQIHGACKAPRSPTWRDSLIKVKHAVPAPVETCVKYRFLVLPHHAGVDVANGCSAPWAAGAARDEQEGDNGNHKSPSHEVALRASRGRSNRKRPHHRYCDGRTDSRAAHPAVEELTQRHSGARVYRFITGALVLERTDARTELPFSQSLPKAAVSLPLA